ncbi:MAG: hypothetical protein Q8M94_22010, partial [Ignavibacteria bacterium]|nr:hypothetical protein [Ignavibacteria bacterium]
MKTFILILCISVLTFCQNEKTKDALILEKFSEVCKSIKHLEYNIERIDTFSSESIRSISGHVLITKENNDKNYGYYFSSECFELNQKSIYDGNNSFDIDTKAKTYRLVKSLKGSPGHQLVLRIADVIFSPDSEYSNVVLLGETNDFYSIEYQYKDDPPITNFRKMILINKLSFLPMEFTISGKNTADRYSYNFILSNLKINENFSSSIEKEKLEFSSYKMLPSENNEMKRSIINLVATNFLLTKLSDLSSMAEIYKGKLTLLDFWEVWCGYCIESMHKIDLL